MSHPTMGAWIEMVLVLTDLRNTLESHPTMGAWIEIEVCKQYCKTSTVAPHDGCVD